MTDPESQLLIDERIAIVQEGTNQTIDQVPRNPDTGELKNTTKETVR